MRLTNSKHIFSEPFEFQSNGYYKENRIISSVNNKEGDLLPIIDLEIKKIKIKALCDSGATVSLLSPIIFKKLKEENLKFKYIGNQIQMQTLTNSKNYFK